MFNILGEEIKKGLISEKTSINITELSKGLYILKLINGNTINFIKK